MDENRDTCERCGGQSVYGLPGLDEEGLCKWCVEVLYASDSELEEVISTTISPD